MLHEHAAALSATSPANRSRRLIKCAKNLHATERCAMGPDTCCKEPSNRKILPHRDGRSVRVSNLRVAAVTHALAQYKQPH